MGFQVLNAADAAYPAMAFEFSSDTTIWEAAGEGYSVLTGGQVVAGTNAGTVKVSAGTDLAAGVAVAYNATDNIACAASADPTNPRWLLIEVDSAGVAQRNLGNAAVNPVPNAPTAGRTVHAAIYIPAAATLVDALLGTANGKCKIIDKRVVIAAGNPIQTFSNADVVCASTTRFLLQTGTMSGAHTVTLPLAAAVSPYTPLTVVDVTGTATGLVGLNFARAGSDTINGGTAPVSLINANCVFTFYSDGISKWVVSGPSPFGGTSGQALISQGGTNNPMWGAVTNVQAFTSSGTWTKPSAATLVRVIAVGSGGGGGSGRLGVITTFLRGGGGGGAAGNWGVYEFQAADLNATESVTIPAGGAGGALRSGAAVNGANGGSPGTTTFGTSPTFVTIAGGGGGVGGSNVTGGTSGSATSNPIFVAPGYPSSSPPNGGGGSSGSNSFGTGGSGSFNSPGAGGGGGGITAGNVADITGGAGGGGGGLDNTGNNNNLAGGAGGTTTGATGTAGAASGTGMSSSLAGGAGGGGGSAGSGGSNATGGGAGGAGGLWGAGGGGGGAGTTNGTTGTSGAGGAGGKGYLLVISYR